MSRYGQLVLIWWTILFMLIWGVAFALLIGMNPPLPATLTAQQVAAFYTNHRMNILIGAMITTVTGAFMAPITSVISYQMARLGREMYSWSILQAGGGIGTTVFISLPSACFGVAAFSPDRPPEITKLIHEFGLILLVTTVQLFIFQLLPIAWACYASKPQPHSAFPRWLGHFTVLQFLIAEMGCTAFLTKTGPFAWGGLFPWILPNIAYFPWIVAIGFTIGLALKHQEAADGRTLKHQDVDAPRGAAMIPQQGP